MHPSVLSIITSSSSNNGGSSSGLAVLPPITEDVVPCKQ